MIEILETYLDQAFLDFLVSLSPLFVVGVLLAVVAWLVGFTIYAAFSLFKKI